MKIKCPLPLLILLNFFALLISFMNNQALAQASASDTLHIKTMIDSCKAKGDLGCASDLLKLIQKEMSVSSNRNEIYFYRIAEIKT